MARIHYRFLTAIALAVAIEHLPAALFSLWPALGRAQVAMAQGPPVGGNYADPTMMGNPAYGNGAIGGNGSAPYLPLNMGPSPPTTPVVATRPSSWPGGAQDPANPNVPPQRAGVPYPAGPVGPSGAAMQAQIPGAMPPAGQTPAAPRKSPGDPPYNPADILAHVGSEVIQANEVLPAVNKVIANIQTQHGAELAKLTPEIREQELNKARRDVARKMVDDLIKMKLLVSEIRHKVPAEGLAKHEEKVRKDFNDRVIKQLIVEQNAASIIDLDEKFRAQGSSLEAQRTVFVERGLALSWLYQQVKDQKEPTHEEMLAFYHQHTADWETPARARWEHLMVKFDNFDSKQSAGRALAQWGNEVLRGAPLAEVAKAHSHAPSADEGGLHDWTSKGSLRSTVLDEALFGLPVGALSQILEDEDGLHIIRIVEREDRKVTAFSELQPEIKKRLHDGNEEKHKLEYVAKLRERTPVWTVFDENADAMAARPGASATR